MAYLSESTKLIVALHQRLNKTAKISMAAKTCSIEGASMNIQRLLEDVEELVREANHLVQASLMLQHLEAEDGKLKDIILK